MQGLTDVANMPYVNVYLDVEAAINAYKLIWSHPQRFDNIFIHLGDFHFIKENFGVIGKLVTGSGFEDVVFQAGVCSAAWKPQLSISRESLQQSMDSSLAIY